jgi:uncharacterized BrkB/YihY/UPF0761 family membrane protein
MIALIFLQTLAVIFIYGAELNQALATRGLPKNHQG